MNSSIQDLNNQIIRRESQLNSTFSSQISFKQAHSVEFFEKQDSQQLSVQSRQTSDSNEQLQTGQYMKQGSDLFNSRTVTLKFSCIYCRYEIDENAIMTPCQHAFHQNCLRKQLQYQLMKKEYYIKCYCGFELNQMLKLQYNGTADSDAYEDILKFEIDNIKKNIRKEFILECIGGPYQSQRIDEQGNLIYEEQWCKAFFINDQYTEGDTSICLYCGRNLYNP